MVRVLPGWHPQTGTARSSGGRVGQVARRPPARPQTAYWRQTAAELWAATPPVTVNAGGNAASFVGPAGVGEVWDVQLVQVNTTTIITGTGCTAQVWRGVAGITQDLLFITQNGTFDNIGVTGRPIRAGEQIIVIWEGARPGDVATAQLTGTKTVLEAAPYGTSA